jgi:retron-type reverse transcriptase
MKEAFRLTRKDGAPGIDGVTAAEYAENLEANLRDLLDRIKSGRYQAPPVRRVYIPKGDRAGSRRPLGLRIANIQVPSGFPRTPSWT